MPPLSRLPSPLCTKLVTFTVYTWVAVSTVSSQNALTEVRTDFPFFTVLQMISYVGALRVGQVRRGGERRQRRRRGRRGEEGGKGDGGGGGEEEVGDTRKKERKKETFTEGRGTVRPSRCSSTVCVSE